jgi:hypothetical protein
LSVPPRALGRLLGTFTKGDDGMEAVLRYYTGQGAKELFDLLERNKKEVENLMKGVKGLVSYTMARSANGGFTVTVCQDKAGVEESIRLARDWISNNAKDVRAASPQITEGTTVVALPSPK